MELRVKFADGTVIPYLNAKEQPEFYDNANRRVLEINFAKDTVSLDALDHLVSNIENVKKIVLINELEKMENIWEKRKKFLQSVPPDLWEDRWNRENADRSDYFRNLVK